MGDWIYVHDLDPILFSLGPFRVGWYGLMYALAFLTAYWFHLRDARRPDALIAAEDVPTLLTYVVLGTIIGGRLGYVLFYGGLPYLYEPWRVFETWKGGMSFHGGLLGVTAAMWLHARRRGLPILSVADFMVAWVPVGLFLGRIGNFINGELYGKPTDGTWGVIFPGDPLGVPRHPSQLYEAFGEGVVIFAVLYALRGRVQRPGLQPAVFLMLYGLARFLVELVRLPDAHIGYLVGFLTMGQLLSLPMLAAGLIWTVYLLSRPPEAPARA